MDFDADLPTNQSDSAKEQLLSTSNEQQTYSCIGCITDDLAKEHLRARKKTARRLIKNLILISFAFFLLFLGVGSLLKLQSTMNSKENIGVDAQVVLFTCSMLSCFIPKPLIEKFGAKTTFTIALLLSCPYIAANFYLRWDIMLSTAALYGLASGPLKSSMSFYLDEISVRYKSLVGESSSNTKALFFGVQVFFGESTAIFGNVISYYALSEGNYTHFVYNASIIEECGANFTPEVEKEHNKNLTPPSQDERNILTGIYFVASVLAVVVACFLDPLENDTKDVRGCETVSRTFYSTVNQLRKLDQLLLIPLSIYTGIENAFYSNEFTEVSPKFLLKY